MNHKLPADLQRKIRNKFPKIDQLDEIVDSIFEAIINKTFDDGSCPIKSFGTFYSYKAFSNKKGIIVPRFKFRIARSLMNSICNDEYILERIEKVVKRVVDSNGKFANKEVQSCRDLNYKKQNEILYNQKIIKKQVLENLIHDEISDILNEEINRE